MNTYNKTFQLLAAKLGLSNEEKVLRKAAELERLLQTKSVAGSNLSDTSKVVICLDLAASLLGADLDVKTAIKYSGLKPVTYSNNRKTVENLLELNCDRVTTNMLCLTLQCTGVQNLADKILEAYQKQAKMEVDLNLPQYVCMAVYQACRMNKVKVPKSKFIEKSRLKPAQWAKLDADWTKFVDENLTVTKKKKGRPAKNTETIEEPQEMDGVIPKKEEQTEPEMEPYEDWKQRILKAAYKELEQIKYAPKNADINEMRNGAEKPSPRRSPRKTPQKCSPYKMPSKNCSVRLLFAVDS